MFSSQKIKIFFWLFAAYFLQNSLNFVLPFKIIFLVTICVVLGAIQEGPGFGALLGALAGLLLDLYGVGRLGPWIFVLSITGLTTGMASRKLFKDSFLTRFSLSMLGIFLSHFLSITLFHGHELFGF